MPKHFSEEAFADLLEGTAGAEVRAHVAACDACRTRLGEAEEGLRLARSADVPEPSPLYWEAFRRQVGHRITDEPWTLWRWRVFGPALAAVAVAVALVSFVPWRAGDPGFLSTTPLPAWSALPSAEEDDGLAVLQAMAASADDLGSAGACRGVSECLAELSDDESRALTDAFRSEMKGRDL